MAEQQALLERLIEAAAPSDSGNITHRHTHTHTYMQLNSLSNTMPNFSADE